MTDTFSVREARSNPAVVREVVEHCRARLRSPDATTQLRAAKSLLALSVIRSEESTGTIGNRTLSPLAHKAGGEVSVAVLSF